MSRSIPVAVFLILTLLTAFGRSARAQESQVRIEGTSSVNSFTCESDDVSGAGLLSGSRATAIEVPVSTLDCGNGRMNKDLRSALRSDEHPLIRFDVSRIDVENTAADRLRIETTGTLTIAGTGRSIALTLDGRRTPNDNIRITGSTALELTSFGIDPPTALMGLVRVHDRVVVHFDLTEPAAALVASGAQ